MTAEYEINLHEYSLMKWGLLSERSSLKELFLPCVNWEKLLAEMFLSRSNLYIGWGVSQSIDTCHSLSINKIVKDYDAVTVSS